MEDINKKMEKRLEIICNEFVEEQIGNAKLQLMPPKDKIPIIKDMHYEKDIDTFKIYFDKCDEYHYKFGTNIDFLENRLGHLMAIYIKNFSKLDIDSIKLNVYTTIKNEIQQVSMEFTAKQDILNKVIDKRKLMFLDNIVKDNYKELKRQFVK